MMRILLLVILALWINVSHASTKVSGLVYLEYFYEEPNYGGSPSTDRIASACLLKLDKPIQSNKIKLLHLIFSPESKMNCAQLQGHQVTIEGDISESITGHQHGDGILDIKKIEITR